MTTNQPFAIRAARDSERAAISELTLAAYGQYAELMAPAAWAGLHQALLGALASEGPAKRIVAVQGDILIGSVMLFPPSGDGTASAGGRMIWPELRLLSVADAWRGRGVGEALVDACIAQARAAGAPTLGLYSSDSMQAAIRLYERKGFERIPEYDFQPPGAELIKAYRRQL
jgi:predicted N-acetyltransferase YhbS